MHFFLDKIIIAAALVVPSLLMFVLWPSRYNFLFWSKFPHLVIAFIVGSAYYVEYTIKEFGISYENLQYLEVVLVTGALIYCVAFFFGFVLWGDVKRGVLAWVNRAARSAYRIKGQHLIVVGALAIVAIASYAFSYWQAGIVPMFADEPMVAKYFAGEYQDAYRPVAHFFRGALNVYIVLMPIMLIHFVGIRKRGWYKLFSLLALGALFVLTMFTLRRGALAAPIMLFLSIFFMYYRRGRFLPLFWIFFILLYGLGSAITPIILSFFTQEKFQLAFIVQGVPDVHDMIYFWDEFIKKGHDFTWGRTIYGGLVPYHYDWNPAVLTKIVIGAGKNVPTGGFRLPFQVEGYYTFGIAGVALWSALYGVIEGVLLSLNRRVVYSYKFNLLMLFYGILSLYFVGLLLHFVLKMRIDNLLQMVLLQVLLFTAAKKIVFHKKVG